MSNIGNKETMAKNIRHFIKQTGKTRKCVCKELGFAYSTFTDWCCARKYPRIDKIELMANYFGIEKSDLIEEKQIFSSLNPIHNNMSLEEFANEFDTTIDHLNNAFTVFKQWKKEVGEFDFDDEEMEELINFAKYLKSKRKKGEMNDA